MIQENKKQQEIEQNIKVRGLQKAEEKRTRNPEMQQTGKKYLYSLMNGAIKAKIEAPRRKGNGWGEREIVKTERDW